MGLISSGFAFVPWPPPRPQCSRLFASGAYFVEGDELNKMAKLIDDQKQTKRLTGAFAGAGGTNCRLWNARNDGASADLWRKRQLKCSSQRKSGKRWCFSKFEKSEARKQGSRQGSVRAVCCLIGLSHEMVMAERCWQFQTIIKYHKDSKSFKKVIVSHKTSTLLDVWRLNLQPSSKIMRLLGTEHRVYWLVGWPAQWLGFSSGGSVGSPGLVADVHTSRGVGFTFVKLPCWRKDVEKKTSRVVRSSAGVIGPLKFWRSEVESLLLTYVCFILFWNVLYYGIQLMPRWRVGFWNSTCFQFQRVEGSPKGITDPWQRTVVVMFDPEYLSGPTNRRILGLLSVLLAEYENPPKKHCIQ